MRVYCAILLVLCFAAPTNAQLALFAKYEWQDGAVDTSGSPLRHDGLLDPMATAADRLLTVDRWDGVYLGSMPELAGATQALLRFEDLTFTKHQESGAGAASNFTVLTGDEMNWWAAVGFEQSPFGNRTTIEFNLGGFGGGPTLDAVVADQVVDHFDSIEYRLDGTATVGQRLAIRWNDGPWIVGGERGDGDRIPSADRVRINNGGPADWDPMWGTLGAVSFYSNQVPEPSTWALLLVGAIGCGGLRCTAKAVSHFWRRWPASKLTRPPAS